jgi:hypothetical protein
MLTLCSVAAYQRARSVIAGITHWCDEVSIDSDDFMTYACGDLLDRIETLTIVVQREYRRLDGRPQAVAVSATGEELPWSDPRFLDPSDRAGRRM